MELIFKLFAHIEHHGRITDSITGGTTDGTIRNSALSHDEIKFYTKYFEDPRGYFYNFNILKYSLDNKSISMIDNSKFSVINNKDLDHFSISQLPF